MEPMSIINETVGVSGGRADPAASGSHEPEHVLTDVVNMYVEICHDEQVEAQPGVERHLQVMQEVGVGNWVWSILGLDDANVGRVLSAIRTRLFGADLKLQLCDVAFAEKTIAAIEAFAPQLLSISIVRATGFTGAVCQRFVAAAVKCSQMSSMVLEGHAFTDDDIDALSNLQHAGGLRHLAISGSPIGWKGMTCLTRLLGMMAVRCCNGRMLGCSNDRHAVWACQRCQRHTVRNLREASMIDEVVKCCGEELGVYARGRAQFTCSDCKEQPNFAPSRGRLQHFSLTDTTIPHFAAHMLAEALRGNVTLTKLCLRNTDALMSHHIVDALNPRTQSSSHNTTIVDLDLSENVIADGVGSVLVETFTHRASLERVVLNGVFAQTEHGRTQLRAVVRAVAEGPRLRVVELSGGVVSDANEDDLVKLAGIPSLRRVVLSHNPKLSDKGLTAFAAKILASPQGNLEHIDIRGAGDRYGAAELIDRIVQSTTITVLRDIDISGEWCISACNVPQRPDTNYRIQNVVHHTTNGKIFGTLLGKTERFSVSGQTDMDARGRMTATVRFDWKGGKESVMTLRVVPAPEFEGMARSTHHATTRVHMVGRLVNSYNSTEGDATVVVIPQKSLTRLDSPFNEGGSGGFRGIRRVFREIAA